MDDIERLAGVLRDDALVHPEGGVLLWKVLREERRGEHVGWTEPFLLDRLLSAMEPEDVVCLACDAPPPDVDWGFWWHGRGEVHRPERGVIAPRQRPVSPAAGLEICTEGLHFYACSTGDASATGAWGAGDLLIGALVPFPEVWQLDTRRDAWEPGQQVKAREARVWTWDDREWRRILARAIPWRRFLEGAA